MCPLASEIGVLKHMNRAGGFCIGISHFWPAVCSPLTRGVSKDQLASANMKRFPKIIGLSGPKIKTFPQNIDLFSPKIK